MTFRPHPRQAKFMRDVPIRIFASDAMPRDRALLISELSADEMAEVSKLIAAGEDRIAAYAAVLVEKRKAAVITGVGKP